MQVGVYPDRRSAPVFGTPGICETMKSMLNMAPMSQRSLEEVAKIGSLFLPVVSTLPQSVFFCWPKSVHPRLCHSS